MTAKCKHRWEPSEFGKRYWAPNTYQHRCARCGEMRTVTLIPEGDVQNAGKLAKHVSGSATDAAT